MNGRPAFIRFSAPRILAADTIFIDLVILAMLDVAPIRIKTEIHTRNCESVSQQQQNGATVYVLCFSVAMPRTCWPAALRIHNNKSTTSRQPLGPFSELVLLSVSHPPPSPS